MLTSLGTGQQNINSSTMRVLRGLMNLYASRGADCWVNEFTSGEGKQRSVDDKWVDEFSNLHIDEEWAGEFGKQVGEGAADSWANAFDEYLNEQVAAKQQSDASRGVYVFFDMNPYVGHSNPFKEGQEMFRKGLLSEAVLALEAEVLKNPDNAEGWRLLGIAINSELQIWRTG